jgi:hypothetical protein
LDVLFTFWPPGPSRTRDKAGEYRSAGRVGSEWAGPQSIRVLFT